MAAPMAPTMDVTPDASIDNPTIEAIDSLDASIANTLASYSSTSTLLTSSAVDQIFSLLSQQDQAAGGDASQYMSNVIAQAEQAGDAAGDGEVEEVTCPVISYLLCGHDPGHGRR